jgi:hypothetical protein
MQSGFARASDATLLAKKTAAMHKAALTVEAGAVGASRGLLALRAALIGLGAITAVVVAGFIGYMTGRGIDALTGGKLTDAVSKWLGNAGVGGATATAEDLKTFARAKQLREDRARRLPVDSGVQHGPFLKDAPADFQSKIRMQEFGSSLKPLVEKGKAFDAMMANPSQMWQALHASKSTEAQELYNKFMRPEKQDTGPRPTEGMEWGSAGAASLLAGHANESKRDALANVDKNTGLAAEWLEKIKEVMDKVLNATEDVAEGAAEVVTI